MSQCFKQEGAPFPPLWGYLAHLVRKNGVTEATPSLENQYFKFYLSYEHGPFGPAGVFGKVRPKPKL